MSFFRTIGLFGLFLAAVASSAAAQSSALDRGSLILGGSADFSSTGHDDAEDRVTVIQASPTIQYFVAPGLAVGGTVIAIRSSLDDVSVTTFGAGPSVSYYFGGADRAMIPFVSADALYLTTDAGDSDSADFGYRASAGLLFMLSPSVGLNTSLYYQQQGSDRNVDEELELDTDTFGLALGFSAFVF